MSSVPRPAVWFPALRAGSGADVFTIRLANGLGKRGIRTEITWLPPRSEYAPWTVPVPTPPAWANIVHVNTWLHPRFVPRNLPVVATIHHAVHHPDARAYKGVMRAAYHRLWVAPIERGVMRRSEKLVAVSQFVCESARESLADLPMQVIHNGVDTEVFHPGDRQRQADDPFRLLYVGSWMARKGVDLLAPIMRKLGNGFELLYTGGSSVKQGESRLPSNMIDIGRLQGDSEVVSAMQSADALLFPSRSEGHPLVALEAIATGLPVIAFKNTCVDEVVIDGCSGILVPKGDVAAATGAAEFLRDNEHVRRKMSLEARRSALAKFGSMSMEEAYIASYRALLAQVPFR